MSATPHNNNALDSPRENDVLTGLSTSVSSAHFLASAACRLRLMLPHRERRLIRKRIRTTLGQRISETELNRLSSAAVLYRKLAAADVGRFERLQWEMDGELPDLQGVICLSPVTPFRGALEHVVGSELLFRRAPMDPAGDDRDLPRSGRILGLHALRLGLSTFRLRVRRLPDHAAADRFLDTCLAENPAQYQWLESDRVHC